MRVDRRNFGPPKGRSLGAVSLLPRVVVPDWEMSEIFVVELPVGGMKLADQGWMYSLTVFRGRGSEWN